ncbi:polyketide synthase, partial [Mycobacterium tuberculosis]
VDPVGAAPGPAPVAVPWVLSARSAPALPPPARRLLAWVGAAAPVRPLAVGWSLVPPRSLFAPRAVVVGAARPP